MPDIEVMEKMEEKIHQAWESLHEVQLMVPWVPTFLVQLIMIFVEPPLHLPGHRRNLHDRPRPHRLTGSDRLKKRR